MIKFNTKNERALVVNETSDLKLVCKAEGHPIPEVKFTFNGNLLANVESKYDQYSKEIWTYLHNVTKKNNGTYACYLNDAVYRSIDLIIKCKSPRELFIKKKYIFKFIPFTIF